MSNAPPAELKAVSPFLQRAAELKSADPVIAYWCTYHAAQLGMSLRPTAPDSRQFLFSLLDGLEATRRSMENNEAITDEAAGSAYVENFALKVFAGADAEDRAGKASQAVAKRFLAAAHFLELLSNFGNTEEEITTKIKYSRWKAADIAKALREGRQPAPGPAGGIEAAADPKDVDASAQDAADVERQLLGRRSVDLSPPPPADPSPSYPFPEMPSRPSEPSFGLPDEPSFGVQPSAQSTPFPTLPAASGALPSPPPRASQPPGAEYPTAFPTVVLPSAPSLPPAHEPRAPAVHEPFASASNDHVDPLRTGEAQKHARWAISALNYDDLPTARKELHLALSLIGG